MATLKIYLLLHKSATWYGGKVSVLLAVMCCNLLAVTLFGGGLMLFVVAAVEWVFAARNPHEATWFSEEARDGAARLGIGRAAVLLPAHGGHRADQPLLPTPLQGVPSLTRRPISGRVLA